MDVDVNLEDLVIDESNFDQYFFDVRKHGAKKGQIMAKYSAIAELVDSPAKRDLIKVLRMKNKGHAAAMVMRKIHLAAEPDCYRVCAEMCEDLISGMTDDEVAKKPYEFRLEAFYYTNRDLVPKNDIHWETIDLLQINPETGAIKFDIY